MSPKIRARQSSAATFFNRIEFIPSRLASAAWLIWLAMAVALIWLAHLHWAPQLGLSILVVGSAGVTLRRFVLLRGPRAIRALEWAAGNEDEFFVCLGVAGRRLRAVPGDCRRYGCSLWVLRFQTDEGAYGLLVDTRLQEPRALRRLARRHIWGAGAPNPGLSGRPVAAS